MVGRSCSFLHCLSRRSFSSCERAVRFSASIKGIEALKRIRSEMLELAKGYLRLKAAATARPLVLSFCTLAFGGKDGTENLDSATRSGDYCAKLGALTGMERSERNNLSSTSRFPRSNVQRSRKPG